MAQDSIRSFPLDLEAQTALLRAALNGPALPPAGRLLGLPELPEGDIWCDIAGASAITGVAPRTISSWLSRRGPRRLPFPEPDRVLYRLYWSVAAVTAWHEDYRASTPPTRA